MFDSSAPASISQLRELRAKSVLHTYLRQQLLRRETISVPEEEYDTQEFVLAKVTSRK